MAKPFAIGDRVGFKVGYGKRGVPKKGRAKTQEWRGVVESVDYSSGYMSIHVGTYPNMTGGSDRHGGCMVPGGCQMSITVERVKGRWLAHRSYQGYKERIYRVASVILPGMNIIKI